MTNRNKARGTATESALVGYLREHGFPAAERRVLHGAKDRGDVTGTPGVCWEAKSGARLCLPAWLRETEIERCNDDARHGVLVVKPVGVGVTRIGEWPAIVPLDQMCELLVAVGYGVRVAS